MSTARELFAKRYEVPAGEQRALLAQAIQLADAAEDLDLAFQIRLALVSASHNDPDGLAMISAYGWCLARHDEDTERFPVSLWYYKWVATRAPRFASINRKQITELLADMGRRFDASGGSQAPVLKERLGAALRLGDIDEAKTLFEQWRSMVRGSRSGLNDCRACDDATEASSLRAFGRHVEALEAADLLLRGEQGCASQPHYALASALESARALGKLGDARNWHAAGMMLIEDDPDYTDALGDHLRHLAIVGDVERATALVDRTLPHLVGNDDARLRYLRGARLSLAAADAAGVANDATASAHATVDGEAERIAAAFDARNGNHYISDKLHHDDKELATLG